MRSGLARLRDEYGWNPKSIAILHHETGVWVAKNQNVGGTVYLDEQWAAIDQLLAKSWWYDTRNRIILDALRSSKIESAI